MAKLIIKLNDHVLDHIELRQGDMKIGRKPSCDVHIDNPAVSGDHANIFTIGEDSFIQDLHSTNGTFINNKKITKHHLRDGDVVTVGQHSLVYLNEKAQPRDDFAKTVVLAPAAGRDASVAEEQSKTNTAPQQNPRGALLVLSGAGSGKRIELTKNVTNLGKTGQRSGAISSTPEGYVLTVGDIAQKPKLNGREIPAEGAKLRNGDVIEVGGTRLQFYLN